MGASQTRIGTATGLAQGSVCFIIKGKHAVSALEVFERIADGLGMPDTARVRLGLAPRGEPLLTRSARSEGKEGTTKRRTALGLGGLGVVAAVSPETLSNVLRDAAGEAMEFTRAIAVTDVGAGTLACPPVVLTVSPPGARARARAGGGWPIARSWSLFSGRGRHGIDQPGGFRISHGHGGLHRAVEDEPHLVFLAQHDHGGGRSVGATENEHRTIGLAFAVQLHFSPLRWCVWRSPGNAGRGRW